MARLQSTDKLWWNTTGHSWLRGAQILGRCSQGAPGTGSVQTPDGETAGVFYPEVLLKWMTFCTF